MNNNRKVKRLTEIDQKYIELLNNYFDKHPKESHAAIARAINPTWTRQKLYRTLKGERHFSADDIACIDSFLGLRQSTINTIDTSISTDELKDEVISYLSQTTFPEYTGMGINQFRNALEKGAINTDFLEYQKVIPLQEVPYILSSRDNMLEQRNFLLGIIKKMNYELELAYMIRDNRYLQEHLFNFIERDGSLIPESLVDSQINEIRNTPTVTEEEKAAIIELESTLKTDEFYAIYYKYTNIMDTMVSIIKLLSNENQELHRKFDGNA